MATTRETIFEEINAERARQDQKWGGPEHDDEHEPVEWIGFIVDHAQAARPGRIMTKDFRQQMVRVAALAVAAIETWDRYMPANSLSTTPPAAAPSG